MLVCTSRFARVAHQCVSDAAIMGTPSKPFYPGMHVNRHACRIGGWVLVARPLLAAALPLAASCACCLNQDFYAMGSAVVASGDCVATRAPKLAVLPVMCGWNINFAFCLHARCTTACVQLGASQNEQQQSMTRWR